MVTILTAFTFILAILVAVWIGYMFTDWMLHGCPNRFTP